MLAFRLSLFLMLGTLLGLLALKPPLIFKPDGEPKDFGFRGDQTLLPLGGIVYGIGISVYSVLLSRFRK